MVWSRRSTFSPAIANMSRYSSRDSSMTTIRPPSLGDWVTRASSPQEIRDLLAVVERDLRDSAARGLSADWRMNIAYNAALQAATAFDSFRKKRNISGYERIGMVSDADADEMHAIASGLRDDVVAWLRTHHAGPMRGTSGRWTLLRFFAWFHSHSTSCLGARPSIVP